MSYHAQVLGRMPVRDVRRVLDAARQDPGRLQARAALASLRLRPVATSDRTRTLLDGFARVFGAGPAGGFDTPPESMIRATNLGNLVAQGLLVTPPAERRAQLVLIGGQRWTTSVLNLASRIGGPLGLTDAVRFSLTLHFLVGRVQHDAGQKTPYTNAYVTASRELRAAIDRKAAPPARTTGLGAVTAANLQDKKYTQCYHFNTDSNRRERITQIRRVFQKALNRAPTDAEIIEWAASRWCSDETLTGIIKGSGGKARPTDLTDRPGVFDRAANAVGQAFEWGADILCKGLSALFGETVGSALCALVRLVLNIFKSLTQATILIVREVIVGLVEFLSALVRGDVPRALEALLGRITTIIFLAPPISTFLAAFLGIPIQRLVELSKEVQRRSKLFVIQVASAIFGLAGGPTPNAVVMLIGALRPAIVVLAAEVILKWSRMARAKIERAVEIVLNLGIAIVLGVVSIKAFVESLREQINRKGGVTAWLRGQLDSLSPRYKAEWEKCKSRPDGCKLLDLVQADLNNIVAKFKSFKLGEIVQSLTDLVTLLSGSEAEAVPPPQPTDPFISTRAAVPKLTPLQKAQVIGQVVRSVTAAESAAYEAGLRKEGLAGLTGSLTDFGRLTMPSWGAA